MSGTLPIRAYGDGQWSLLVHGTEVWCKDKGVLLVIRDALTGPPRGPLLPVADMDRLYFPGIDIAHLKHPAAPGLFCDPDAPADAMRGTGTQEEREWAAGLRSCRPCVQKASAMRAAR